MSELEKLNQLLQKQQSLEAQRLKLQAEKEVLLKNVEETRQKLISEFGEDWEVVKDNLLKEIAEMENSL